MNAATKALMVHVDCEKITQEQLRLLPTPEPRSRIHKPIPHHRFDSVLRDVLGEYEFEVTSAAYGCSKADAKVPFGKLFATYALSSPHLPAFDDKGLVLGLRHGNGGQLGAKGVAGKNVFVCDNMALSGEDFLFYGKHTKGLELIPMIESGVQVLADKWQDVVQRDETLYEKLLTPNETKQIFWDCIHQKVVTPAEASRGYNSYMAEDLPEIVDHQGSLGALQECVTRQLRNLPVRQKLDKTQRLAKFIDAVIA